MSRFLFCLFCTLTYSFAISQATEKNYIFFLHNRFLEDFPLEVSHDEYGKVEYHQILDAFRKEGFVVMSEIRPSKTDMRTYAKKIVAQIDSLFKLGVEPEKITVIGTSKGGYIAQYVSSYLSNPKINYVFIGAFQDADIKSYPDLNWCGNILSIYDVSDFYGVSAKKKIELSTCDIKHFKEIELDTKLKHGFLYKAMDEWIEPSIRWAKGERG